MAASIPTIIHHKLNAEPIKEDPSKFYYHLLYKALILAILIILPFFPAQAPEFINQSLLTRNWELFHLLFVGIAISYGLFCRRSDGTDKENHNSKFDTAQSYVSRFLPVSSFFEDDGENETPSGDDEDSKTQTWNNYQYRRNEPLVVLAPKHSNSYDRNATNTRISEKPLLLPVRSLKSRVSDPCPVQSVNKSNLTSVSVNGSGSKHGSRRFSRNAEIEGSGGRPTMEDRSKDNVVLPSPIPWRSESLMKLQNSRLSRPNPMSSSTSLSSPKPKDQSLSSPSFASESLAKNSEDTVIKNKVFYKSAIPPPPPPPPMLFKSISMKPRTSSLNQAVSSDKDMKRSFTTSERRDKPRGLHFENNNMRNPLEAEGEVKRMASVGFAEEEKVIMGFDEDTETEDEGGGDEAGRSRIEKDKAENQPNNEENPKIDQGTGGIGEEGPDVDKKADEFIAKFREQIRLQRIDSIKRSANRMARNSSR
ncbi:uncharacterized protein LOC114742307 [Neltuma alba]|uniref:uncharacterized protein LOC114742307 n=1 Tax=Neltuma alba TaxID=207710 RepID=UPI0010A42CE0|nr:uncharacterized protein LOC114742307 [Prosopis alba]